MSVFGSYSILFSTSCIFLLILVRVRSDAQLDSHGHEENITVPRNSTIPPNFISVAKISDVEGGIQIGNKPLTQKDQNYTLSLPTPPGYRKWELPLHSRKKWRVYAFVSIFIRAVLEINEKDEEVVLDTDFGMQWVDWKIQEHLKNTSMSNGSIDYQHRTLDADVLRYIWKPDLFIDEMSSVQQTSVISKLITLNFLGGPDGGDIVYSARTALKLRCGMSFEYYPADTQICQYYIRSYSYNASKFDLLWNIVEDKDYVGVYLNDPSDPNFDIQISDVGPNGTAKIYIQEMFDDFRSGNYTALTFTLKARRKLSYHLVQTYLPSVLLILITWLCFLLPGDMVEARIGISMTTVLTLTALFGAVRQQSPAVSYTMAIDIWCLFCIFLVFIALLLFTIMHWMTIKLKERIEHTTKTKYTGVMEFMKRYAFLGFALIFMTFIITYWSWLLLSSGYYDWEPRPEFNGSPNQDEDGNDFSSRYKYHDVDSDPYSEDSDEVPTTNQASFLNETMLMMGQSDDDPSDLSINNGTNGDPY